MKKTTKSERVNYIFAFLSGAVLSVCLIYFGIQFYIDNLKLFIFILFSIIFCFIIFSYLVLKYQEPILLKLFGLEKEEFESADKSLVELGKNINDRNMAAASKNIKELSGVGKVMYSELMIRNLIFKTINILFLGFAGLIGSAILFNQNKILEDQNEFLANESVNERLFNAVSTIYNSNSRTAEKEMAIVEYLTLAKYTYPQP